MDTRKKKVKRERVDSSEAESPRNTLTEGASRTSVRPPSKRRPTTGPSDIQSYGGYGSRPLVDSSNISAGDSNEYTKQESIERDPTIKSVLDHTATGYSVQSITTNNNRSIKSEPGPDADSKLGSFKDFPADRKHVDAFGGFGRRGGNMRSAPLPMPRFPDEGNFQPGRDGYGHPAGDVRAALPPMQEPRYVVGFQAGFGGFGPAGGDMRDAPPPAPHYRNEVQQGPGGYGLVAAGRRAAPPPMQLFPNQTMPWDVDGPVDAPRALRIILCERVNLHRFKLGKDGKIFANVRGRRSAMDDEKDVFDGRVNQIVQARLGTRVQTNWLSIPVESYIDQIEDIRLAWVGLNADQNAIDDDSWGRYQALYVAQ